MRSAVWCIGVSRECWLRWAGPHIGSNQDEAGMSDSPPNLAELDRMAEIRRVLDLALQRRSQGGELSGEAICQEHPHLLPELANELRKLRLIARAREQSQQHARPPNAAIDETTAFVSGQTPARLSRSLHI